MIRTEAIGNVGRDPELRTTAGGTQVLNFSVGAKGSRKDSETVWLSVAVFGARAEKLQPYIKKGGRIFIRGEFKIRQWSKGDKSGVDIDVTADEVELLGDRQEQQEAPVRRPQRAATLPADTTDYSGDDIPF
jgi:single-strand DNA-binding protein